jgi:hypothetical protein
MVEEMIEELEHLRRRSHWGWISDYHMDVVGVIVRTDRGRCPTRCMRQLERPQRQHRSQLVRQRPRRWREVSSVQFETPINLPEA